MNILAVGDIVGDAGMIVMRDFLKPLMRDYAVDFCVINGENASRGNGIKYDKAHLLLDYGADILTTGNHTWKKEKDFKRLAEEDFPILRPLNDRKKIGNGVRVMKKNGVSIAVINLIGNYQMAEAENPFNALDEALSEIEADIVLVDFHAEATSEKIAMGWHGDGRVSAVWGTHTHVPTADLRILPKGTGYITDLGMTGARDGILGIEREPMIYQFRTGHHEPFVQENRGSTILCGAVFTIDEKTGRTTKVQQIQWIE